jgi:hypothetical protein
MDAMLDGFFVLELPHLAVKPLTAGAAGPARSQPVHLLTYEIGRVRQWLSVTTSSLVPFNFHRDTSGLASLRGRTAGIQPSGSRHPCTGAYRRPSF